MSPYKQYAMLEEDKDTENTVTFNSDREYQSWLRSKNKNGQ